MKTDMTTQLIQIIHSIEITQYTDMIVVGVIFYSKTISHTNEKVNQELQIQALSGIVADLQNQINNFTFARSDPNEFIIGIIQMNSLLFFYKAQQLLYIQICGREFLYTP